MIVGNLRKDSSLLSLFDGLGLRRSFRGNGSPSLPMNSDSPFNQLMTPAYITLRSYRIVYVLGRAAVRSIQIPNGGLFSACLQNSVEWEDRLTSSAHIPALGGCWNMQDVGSRFIHMIFPYFFIFASWFTHTS